MKILLNYFYMGAHATYEYLNIDRSMTEGMTYQYTEVICWLYGCFFSLKSNRQQGCQIKKPGCAVTGSMQ